MKFICGPMATISHPAFRILIEKFGGCDEYFTEMINASSLLNAGPYEKYYIDPAPVPEKIVWQLTGKDEEPMAKAAEILAELPGIGIDVNMGCSAPDIYKTGAGIAWMLKPREETFKMVKAVANVVDQSGKKVGNKKRLSVKLRLGDENFKEQDFFDFCDGLADLGVELFTLHPRTKKEKLARPARYEYCQRLAEKMHGRGIEVYLNGNVKDSASMVNALNKAPDVDGIMISRAAVEHPWIFSKLKQSCEEKIYSEHEVDMLQIALDYIDDIEKFQPKDFWKTRLQRFFTYYSGNFLFGHFAQTEFLNASDNEDLRCKLKLFFEKCPEERFKMI